MILSTPGNIGDKRTLAGAGPEKHPRERDEQGRASAHSRESRESRMNRIARRSHEIYQARGGEDGQALDDWLQAEREVDAEMETSRGRNVNTTPERRLGNDRRRATRAGRRDNDPKPARFKEPE